MSVRTRAQLAADFADNTTGDVSPARLRNLVDSVTLTKESWVTLVKTADTTRAATAVLANDPDLQIATTAGKLYIVSGVVHFDIANGTMDFKYGFAHSGTSSSIRMSAAHSDPGKAAATGFEFMAYQQSFPSSSPLGSAASSGRVTFDGTIVVTGGGIFAFQWAQNTSDAGNATVRAGSRIEYIEI